MYIARQVLMVTQWLHRQETLKMQFVPYVAIAQQEIMLALHVLQELTQLEVLQTIAEDQYQEAVEV